MVTGFEEISLVPGNAEDFVLTLSLSGKVTTNGNGVLVVARDSTTCK